MRSSRVEKAGTTPRGRRLPNDGALRLMLGDTPYDVASAAAAGMSWSGLASANPSGRVWKMSQWLGRHRAPPCHVSASARRCCIALDCPIRWSEGGIPLERRETSPEANGCEESRGEATPGPISDRGHRRVGGGPRGARGFPEERATREPCVLRGRSAHGSDAQGLVDGAARPRVSPPRRPGGGAYACAAPQRLRDPAEQGPVDRRWRPPPSRARRTAGVEAPYRLLLPLAGRRPWRAQHWRSPLGHGLGRHAGAPGHSGEGGGRLRAGPCLGALRRDASQRHRPGAGRRGGDARRAASPDRRVRRARRAQLSDPQRASRQRRSGGARRHHRSPPHGDRPRLLALQAMHHPSACRAANGASQAEGREPVREALAGQSRRGRPPFPGAAHRRDELLS